MTAYIFRAMSSEARCGYGEDALPPEPVHFTINEIRIINPGTQGTGVVQGVCNPAEALLTTGSSQAG